VKDTVELIRLKEEIEGLRVIEAKWTELLPKLEILRQYLFRVDHKLASLSDQIEEPAEIVDFTSAFLSVLQFYFPSTEEEALEAKELTRLEALGRELNQEGNELKEEVKREFASLKAQVETEIGRLEKVVDEQKKEIARLRLSENILTGMAAQLKAMLTEAQEEAEQLRESISLSGVAETMSKYVAKIERLEAELARLRPHADPRLLAAVAEVLDAYAVAEDVDDIGGAMERLADAWETLPAVEGERGPDPDCPNCDGTGGALPGGACGVCWNWDPSQYPDRVDGKWPEVTE
jgi:chromosome segregation ATPase